MEKTPVAVAMSGGVDSAATALLLRERYAPTGVTLRMWEGSDPIPAGRAAAEAGRLREYFRFWTQNQPDMETFSAPIVTQAQEASVIVCYREEGEPGILKQGNTVFITGKGQQLQEMNDLFMTALDKVYVYYGIFGDQMATKMWDHVSTSEQRKLQEKCNAVKNLLSVEAVTPGFIEYIRENKTDTAAGF
jgi:hypothetical protein